MMPEAGQPQQTASASLAAFKPPAQRRLRLTRAAPGKKAFNADVLIKIGPVDALALPNQSPVCSFGLAAMSESRVPRQRHRDGPTIDKVNHQRMFGERHPQRSRLDDVTR